MSAGLLQLTTGVALQTVCTSTGVDVAVPQVASVTVTVYVPTPAVSVLAVPTIAFDASRHSYPVIVPLPPDAFAVSVVVPPKQTPVVPVIDATSGASAVTVIVFVPVTHNVSVAVTV